MDGEFLYPERKSTNTINYYRVKSAEHLAGELEIFVEQVAVLSL